MDSLKRKYDETDLSDNDEPAYGKQILPVANLPNDFNEEPMDGMQYLFTVRRAARLLPDIAHVPNPYAQPRTIALERHSETQESILPSEEWRGLFTYRFANFQKNLNQRTIYVGPSTHGDQRLLPEKKDRDMWWAFFAGRPKSEWTPKMSKRKAKKQQQTAYRLQGGLYAWGDESLRDLSYFDPTVNDEGEVEQVLRVDPSETLPSPRGTPIPVELTDATPNRPRSECSPREPTTHLLSLIDQRTALHLLMYFCHWIQVFLKAPQSGLHIPTETHARWIFALASRLEDQIAADDMNLLRNLARACIGLLKEIRQSGTITNPTIMGENSCWLIITLIADVWRQRDLWMDAQSALQEATIVDVNQV